MGSLLAVPPEGSFHAVAIGDGDRVTGFTAAVDLDLRINGGYFVLRQEIFDYLREGDDLVMDGCRRAAAGGPPAGHPVRRVLGADGHAQGAVGAREPVADGRVPLGGVAQRRGRAPHARGG